MKGYGTNYKPLGKNNSVAYFDKPVEELIADNGHIGEALPQKIQYTLPQSNLEVYAPIDGDIQYLKLDLEDSKGTKIYFYREDMSEVLAVNKENELYMTGTFTIDGYYTCFYDMANIIEEVNPEVYFLRRFAGRFDEGNLTTNLHERGGFKNALPIEMTPDYKTNIDVTNRTLMELNGISSFTTYGFEEQNTGESISSIPIGDYYTKVRFTSDFKVNRQSELTDHYIRCGYDSPGNYTILEIIGGYDDADGKGEYYPSFNCYLGKGQDYSFSLYKEGDKPPQEGSAPDGPNSLTNGSVHGDRNSLTITSDNPVLVNTKEVDLPYSGDIQFGLVSIGASLTTTFSDQSIGNKYRYAVVSKSAFTDADAVSSFAQNGVDLVLIPLPMRDYMVTDQNGSSVTYDINKFNELLYNSASSSSVNFLGNETNVKACFESPICFDLIANNNAKFYYLKNGTETPWYPLFYYPLTSYNNNSYVPMQLSSIPSFDSYLDWTQYNEPYLLYNNQFRRFDLGLEHGIEIPLYDLTGQYNVPNILSCYIFVNNDMKIGLNPSSFSEGSAKYQDMYEYQAKISNNIVKDTTAYNNWLAYNIQTEQTARANLQDQHTIMQRQQAMNWLGVAQNALDIGFGDYDTSKYVPYGKGAGKRALKKVPGFDTAGLVGNILGGVTGMASTVLENQNLSTEFGIKSRNLNTQFANIRKSPASITNQDADKEMVPFLTDGLRVILGELTPAQKNVVMQEIYNYGYAYDGVAPFREYNNRGLYNVIQINTDYNREQLETIIKENYTGIGNYKTAIDSFLDWMGSIHRVYKTNTFDVDQTQNIEIKLKPSTYTIVPETYIDINNSVHGVATIKLPDGSIYGSEGAYDLNIKKQNVSSGTVDFSDLPGGEEHEFSVNGQYVPISSIVYTIDPVDGDGVDNTVNGTATMTITAGVDSPKNITDLVKNDIITKITFGDDFQLLKNFTQDEKLTFTDGSYFVLGENDTDYDVIYHSRDGSDVYTIYSLNNGGFQPSHDFPNGTKGDLDTKTLTFGDNKTVVTNEINPENYVGIVYGYIISRSITKTGTEILTQTINSFTVDFSDVRYGEKHKFDVNGVYTKPGEIGNIANTSERYTLTASNGSSAMIHTSVGNFSDDATITNKNNGINVYPFTPNGLDNLLAGQHQGDNTMTTIVDDYSQLRKTSSVGNNFMAELCTNNTNLSSVPNLSFGFVSAGNGFMSGAFNGVTKQYTVGDITLSSLSSVGDEFMRSTFYGTKCLSVGNINLGGLKTVGNMFMQEMCHNDGGAVLSSCGDINLSSLESVGDQFMGYTGARNEYLQSPPNLIFSSLSSVGSGFMEYAFASCSRLVVSTYQRDGASLLKAPDLKDYAISSYFMNDCFNGCILLDISKTPTIEQLQAGIGIGGPVPKIDLYKVQAGMTISMIDFLGFKDYSVDVMGSANVTFGNDQLMFGRNGDTIEYHSAQYGYYTIGNMGSGGNSGSEHGFVVGDLPTKTLTFNPGGTVTSINLTSTSYDGSIIATLG